jgi:GntP family gluconate:H+ symporter
MWTGHDTALVLYAVIAIAVVVGLVVVLKLHPFLALLIGALTMGILGGLAPDKLIDSFTGGAGDTMGNVGIILALGTMLGALLAESGGAERVASTILDRSGPDRVPWAMALVAAIVGIPLFFEIGVVLLIPIIFTMVRRVQATRPEGTDVGQTYLLVGLPALAGLSVLHGLVPPHPGPLIAIDAVKANIGTTILYGFIVAVPTVIIAGPVFARFASRWATSSPPQNLVDTVAKHSTHENPPSFGAVMFTILLPVGIMLLRTLADVTLDEDDKVRQWAEFIGDPIIALLLGLLVALWTLGFSRGFDRETVSGFLGASLAPAAGILLIIGAGGGFKGVLIDSGIGDAIAKGVEDLSVSALLLGWLVAVMIRLATGSATVATITAAGIMAPIAASGSVDVNASLLALAIGSGSLFFSHVNDAGFWLINQYFGMSVKDTIKTWSLMETIISVVGLIGVLLLNLVV